MQNKVVFTTKEDAENVLSVMKKIVKRYGRVSVADLYDLAGLSKKSTHEDSKTGWINISEIDIMKVEDGYIIFLPSPKTF